MRAAAHGTLAAARGAAFLAGALPALGWCLLALLERAAGGAFGLLPFLCGGRIAADGKTTVATGVFTLLSLLILTPLSHGVTLWCCRLCEGERIPVAAAFAFFASPELYRRSVGLGWLLGVRAAAAAAFALLTPLGLWKFASRFAGDGGVTLLLAASLRVCAPALGVLLGVLSLLWLQRYALAPALLCFGCGCRPREALRRSARMMQGRLGAYLRLRCALLGWAAVQPVCPYALALRRCACARFAQRCLSEESSVLLR